MNHVVMFSGGVGSWATAKRVAQAQGTRNLSLLFTDTMMEDEDLYRFLIEGAANVAKVPTPRCAFYTLPTMESGRLAERWDLLAMMQREAQAAIPCLRWIADGRDPWMVFNDERLLGNSRFDPCSKILKRKISADWLTANCDPADTIAYVGVDWSEEHRFIRLRDRWASMGWTYQAPLCDAPHLTKKQMFEWLALEGVTLPRLYTLGFAHNNCGGFCIKAGKGHYERLLNTMPERYRYHEAQEKAIRERLGKNVSILLDTKTANHKTVKTPLTLEAFRQRIQGGEAVDRFEIGGCGCFIDEEDV